MPTYQYACKDCDYQFEQVQAFSDPSLTTCPNCEGHLRKVYGSVGVVFKGSGFYRTDSRAGAGKASLTADHKSDSAPAEAAPTVGAGKANAATKTKASSPAAATAASAPAKAAS